MLCNCLCKVEMMIYDPTPQWVEIVSDGAFLTTFLQYLINIWCPEYFTENTFHNTAKSGKNSYILSTDKRTDVWSKRFHNMKNQFCAVGRWSGLDCEIKGSGPIMSNFWGPFFHFFGVKIKKKKNFENFFLSPKKWKNQFFLGLKMPL